MSGLILAKANLPEGFIDCSVGEPYIVRDILESQFKLTPYELPDVKEMFEYPLPTGYKPLVKLLEDLYQAPVVITNGAKQALGASFYALKRMGKMNVGMRSPYWALIPPLVKMHGLNPLPSYVGADANLLLLPNNPDGFISRPDAIQGFSDVCKERGVPLIHDAAYYTRIYMPVHFPLNKIGDVQIYSISKMLGLSGLRIGFVVCPNVEFYKYIQEYMETMTVGVSIVSQIFLYDLLNKMIAYPQLTKRVEVLSSIALHEAKRIFREVDSQVLEMECNPESVAGMFGWFKIGPKADFTKSKVNVIEGTPFGRPGYVRINLAFSQDVIKEIVNRLNSVIA
jgi:aspartate aminotransferase